MQFSYYFFLSCCVVLVFAAPSDSLQYVSGIDIRDSVLLVSYISYRSNYIDGSHHGCKS